VILPAFTFFATVGCISRAGAGPVFVDVDPVTYNIDPHQVENKITPRTRALLVVHLFGQCADMEPLWEIADRHRVAIIEDAAQSFGAEYQGKRAGTLGAINCLSFYPSKILGACGDAGMLVTNDPEWAAKAACLRVHGMEPKYYHPHVGWNARMDAIQAALLRVKLPHVNAWIEARQAAAQRYDKLIEQHHLAQFLERPVVLPGRRHVFNQYVIRVADGQRDALVHHLKSHHIGCDIYYPVPLHLQPCLASMGWQLGDFPASETVADKVLALPIYPEITAAQQERVIHVCAEFLRQKSRKAA
ncbi:MAG: DegT/DnrJ/EryC1/StrS family aminotransferase, partial [Mariprofundaceae bacterium]|nr:DegT/DnrJ/EryC1/StrS family aminotransferase [Mariprofundaceae bacterium]